MTNMSLDDAIFLHGESPGKPAHVIALQLFEPPEGATADYPGQLYDDMLELENDVKPAFRKHPKRKLTSPSVLQWVDDGLDLDFHVRRTALPHPGRIRELLETVSLAHGVNLDRSRPLWEFHLIEGIKDGRFATTFKTHHSLADGISLAQHVLGGLSPDPDSRSSRPPWAIPPATEPRAVRERQTRRSRDLLSPARLGVSTLKTLKELRHDVHGHLPFEAPRSVLNSDVGVARRFAGDKWEHSRFKAVSTAAGYSVNDVILSVCGGALRGFLDELGELPDRSLIAMVPVSLRRPGSEFTAGEGNAFGAILCDLETTEADAGSRLASIAAQMKSGKERLGKLSTKEALAVSRILMGGAVLNALGLGGTPRQAFNLIISNVPASSDYLYWNGARMTDIYPISMISSGQALNITVTRYADTITFGAVGDRKALPHLQRMLIHLDNALADVEKAASA